MVDLKKVVSADLLLIHPKYKKENGTIYKLESFTLTADGVGPVYVETDEVDDSEAIEILLGGAS